MRTITPATNTWITLDEVKAVTNYDGTDHDDRLTSLMTDALDWLQEQTDRAFSTQTLEIDLGHIRWREPLLLPRAPLQSVTSIKYWDQTNTQQTLDLSLYNTTVNDNTRGYVSFPKQLPPTFCRPDAWTIRFVAGWSAVPGRIHRVLLAVISQMDFDRTLQQQNFAAMDRAIASIRSDYLC